MSEAIKQPIKVLIADDDVTTRMVIRASISQWGYQVVEAENGEEAYKILKGENIPEIVLLDWIMPQLDGLSLCNRLTAEIKNLPYIIFLSYNSGLAQIVKAIDAGASEFISKPLNVSELRIRLLSASKFIQHKRSLKILFDNIKKMNELFEVILTNNQQLKTRYETLKRDLSSKDNLILSKFQGLDQAESDLEKGLLTLQGILSEIQKIAAKT